MDQEIVSAPIRLLDKLQKEGKLPNMRGRDGDFGVQQSEALATLLPALSGSCALLAFLDAGRNKLHIACTGDSRAVMGVWVPDGSKEGGKWRVQPLSEDQTGRNPKEVERIQKEHPAEEKDTVIVRGRVLGGLEPTRAFGDSRYKWPPGTQQKLAAAFHVSLSENLALVTREPLADTTAASFSRARSVGRLETTTLLPTYALHSCSQTNWLAHFASP